MSIDSLIKKIALEEKLQSNVTGKQFWIFF